MYAVTLAVSKFGRATSSFLQRRRKSSANDTQHEAPRVEEIDNTNRAICPPSRSPQHMPLAYSCCMRWAWPAVTFRCATHPQEVHVSVRDKNGDTALHWACLGKPSVDAVEALLFACPELAAAVNHKGQLPLHGEFWICNLTVLDATTRSLSRNFPPTTVACSYRASSLVIRVLLRAFPEAAGMANKDGSYPLHILCDYGCVVDSIRAVLETEGGVKSLMRKDCIFRRFPLQILNGRRGTNPDFDNLRQERAKYAVGDETQYECLRMQELVTSCEAVEFWQKVSLLILAEYKSSPFHATENVKNEYIVHACASIQDCPPRLLEYALLLYPEQLLMKDENGHQLPLHIAASRADASVKDVLRTNPGASKIRNGEGRLAVELAVESGLSWTDGVGPLLLANPVSLESLNVDERLYPWIWSSLSRKPHGSASALYESLRARPSIVG